MPFIKEDNRVTEVVDDSSPREEADDASAGKARLG